MFNMNYNMPYLLTSASVTGVLLHCACQLDSGHNSSSPCENYGVVPEFDNCKLLGPWIGDSVVGFPVDLREWIFRKC